MDGHELTQKWCTVLGDKQVGISTLLSSIRPMEVRINGEMVQLRFNCYTRLTKLSAQMGFMSSQHDMFLLCFAIDSPFSLQLLRSNLGPRFKNSVKVVVGTKLDLRDDPTTTQRLEALGSSTVTYQQGLSCAKDIGAVAYHECSVLTYKGIRSLSKVITYALTTNKLDCNIM